MDNSTSAPIKYKFDSNILSLIKDGTRGEMCTHLL